MVPWSRHRRRKDREQRRLAFLIRRDSNRRILIPDDGGSTHLWNVGRQLFYTAVQPRRQLWTSYSPPWELEISHGSNCLLYLKNPPQDAYIQNNQVSSLKLGCSTKEEEEWKYVLSQIPVHGNECVNLYIQLVCSFISLMWNRKIGFCCTWTDFDSCFRRVYNKYLL
jgi:hypothetical protein